jgi:hypothetical protein
VFVAGTLFGSLATTTWLRTRPHPSRTAMERRDEARAIRRIARQLDLDESQRRILEKVAAETRVRMKVFRAEARHRINEILDLAMEELRPTLREDQRAKLTQMRERTRRRFEDSSSRRESGSRHKHHDDDSDQRPAR